MADLMSQFTGNLPRNGQTLGLFQLITQMGNLFFALISLGNIRDNGDKSTTVLMQFGDERKVNFMPGRGVLAVAF